MVGASSQSLHHPSHAAGGRAGWSLQLTQSRVLCCLPWWNLTITARALGHLKAVNASSMRDALPLPTQNPRRPPPTAVHPTLAAVCYEKQLHWFATKFFPTWCSYAPSLQPAATSGFHYPSTSSRLSSISLAILHKCFDSPWTTRALSETVAEQSV